MPAAPMVVALAAVVAPAVDFDVVIWSLLATAPVELVGPVVAPVELSELLELEDGAAAELVLAAD